jgi:hypothetical protein
VYSGSERGSFRSRVPSTSQDLVPQGTGPLILSTAQSVWTRNPHFYRFYRYDEASGDALPGVATFPNYPVLHVLNQGQKYE